MKYLITGGAGFIGSALVRRLHADGHELLVVDNLSTGRQENLPKEVELFDQDVAEPKFADRLPKESFDAVLHLAAQTSSAGSDEDPGYDLRANAGSTLQLARFCAQRGIKRFLFAGSMASYGDARPLPVRM